MSNIVRDLPPLKNATSSGGNAVTNGIGKLDDASSITLFFVSTASGVPTSLQVSQFDPTDPAPPVGTAQSTQWFLLSSATFAGVTAGTVFASSGNSIVITGISFRGLRIGLTASSSFAGDVIAFASKQISV